MGFGEIIDEVNRRVLITSPDGISGQAATRIIVDMVRQRPELTGWDWVHDVRRALGDVSVDDISEVARAFANPPPGVTFTIFVSTDANLGTWARAMDFEFVRRRHLCAPTPEAALALLERHRAAISPVPSSM
jgi:hypothetical protein